MPALKGVEVYKLAVQAGFSPRPNSAKIPNPGAQGGVDPFSAAVVATAIAKAESGWNPRAVNETSGATGLWQIHPGGKRYLPPKANARAAYAKYRGQGWDAWSAFTSGAYRQFLTDAENAQWEYENGRPLPTPDRGRVEPGLGIDIPNPLEAVGRFLATLGSGAFWIRALMVIGGGILGILALNMLLKMFGVNIGSLATKGVVK